jgi:hypothetical protein
MNKIFLKIVCTFIISISNVISATETNTPESLHALCARQDQHEHALELLRTGQYSAVINDLDASGLTPLHIVSAFVWTPDSCPPAPYPQGKEVLKKLAATANYLAQLLITQGATNASDINGNDCIAIAGRAWSDFSFQNTTPSSSQDQGVLNTRTWLKNHLEQAPKKIQQAIQTSWPESPDAIAQLIISFVR